MKEYRAIGNRCAVDFSKLDHFGVTYAQKYIIQFLQDSGFRILEINMIELAREYVGKAKYKRGARISEAPYTFDCSSLTKWLYGQIGIWLPRRSIQQVMLGEEISLNNVCTGDLVFTSGNINYFKSHPGDISIGHVGIATGDGTVIHAANKQYGICETAIESFIQKNEYVEIVRRYISGRTVTLEIPEGRDVESSDDINWIIRQNQGLIYGMIMEGPEEKLNRKATGDDVSET